MVFLGKRDVSATTFFFFLCTRGCAGCGPTPFLFWFFRDLFLLARPTGKVHGLKLLFHSVSPTEVGDFGLNFVLGDTPWPACRRFRHHCGHGLLGGVGELAPRFPFLHPQVGERFEARVSLRSHQFGLRGVLFAVAACTAKWYVHVTNKHRL